MAFEERKRPVLGGDPKIRRRHPHRRELHGDRYRGLIGPPGAYRRLREVDRRSDRHRRATGLGGGGRHRLPRASVAKVRDQQHRHRDRDGHRRQHEQPPRRADAHHGTDPGRGFPPADRLAAACARAPLSAETGGWSWSSTASRAETVPAITITNRRYARRCPPASWRATRGAADNSPVGPRMRGEIPMRRADHGATITRAASARPPTCARSRLPMEVSSSPSRGGGRINPSSCVEVTTACPAVPASSAIRRSLVEKRPV